MSTNNLLTVLMPVFNCEKYIGEAIESVLRQTFTDFELIIIDDCSKDETVNIINSFLDPRIKLIEKQVNSGYTRSLNMGLKMAKSKYIARMDGDDINEPDRFLKQVTFLDDNPDVALCGTQYKILGSDVNIEHPLEHDEIKVKLIKGCFISHPTVMFRKSALINNGLEYDYEMEPAEDYDLWSKMVFLEKLSNLGGAPLLKYRKHGSQVSIKKHSHQASASNKIRLRMLRKVIPELPYLVISKEFNNHTNCFLELKERLTWIDKLIAVNQVKKIYSIKLFNQLLRGEKIKQGNIFLQIERNLNLIKFIYLIKTIPRFFFANRFKRNIILLMRSI